MIVEDSTEEVFDALANEDRRQLLVNVLEDDWCYVPKLPSGSEEIADAHGSLLLDHLHSSRHIAGVDERLLRIHHIHLPKLEEYGFIDWQRNTQTVIPGHRFDQLQPYLEVLEDTQSECGARKASKISSR